MTPEQVLTTWFAGHPFLRSELLLAVGTVSAYAKKDYEKYKRAKALDPTLTFRWDVACKQYLEAILLATLPPLSGKVWMILGGT